MNFSLLVEIFDPNTAVSRLSQNYHYLSMSCEKEADVSFNIKFPDKCLAII